MPDKTNLNELATLPLATSVAGTQKRKATVEPTILTQDRNCQYRPHVALM